MERIITKEIPVEIETIRRTKKRSVRKSSPEQKKTDAPHSTECRVKADAHLQQIFNKF